MGIDEARQDEMAARVEFLDRRAGGGSKALCDTNDGVAGDRAVARCSAEGRRSEEASLWLA